MQGTKEGGSRVEGVTGLGGLRGSRRSGFVGLPQGY